MLLALLAEPTWIEPSRTPSTISVCIPADEYVRSRVRSATVAAASDADLGSLLHQLGESQEDASEARSSRDTWITILGTSTLLAIGLAIAATVSR